MRTHFSNSDKPSTDRSSGIELNALTSASRLAKVASIRRCRSREGSRMDANLDSVRLSNRRQASTNASSATSRSGAFARRPIA